MAIEKKLICFARLEEFERQLAAGNILDYSIVFIQDAKKIWTRGTYYDCNSDIKQDTLVSGTNIKTINGESILGEGDLTIKERELEKYDTDKSWSIVVSNTQELSTEHGNAPDGTKAIAIVDETGLYGVNLMDLLMGNVDNAYDLLNDPSVYIEISAIDTSVELPMSTTSDVSVTLPFNNSISIDMGADMASVYSISIQIGFKELVWYEGHWQATSYMIGNILPMSRLLTSDDNTLAGLITIAPALIVDVVIPKTIIEFIKNGDNWEVWSEGKSVLNTQLNEWANLIVQSIPTKTSQLENDSNFISSDGLKTINGESIVGSGDITISGGSSSGAYSEVNHGTADTTFTLTPNTFHVWNEVASLTLDFGSETSGVANEYLFQFTSGSTATSLTLPDDIKWANDSAPTIEANMIYQVSVLKGLASVLEFANAPALIENKATVSISGTQYLVSLQYAAASDIIVKVRTRDGGISVNILSGEISESVSGISPIMDSGAYIESITPAVDNNYIYTW